MRGGELLPRSQERDRDRRRKAVDEVGVASPSGARRVAEVPMWQPERSPQEGPGPDDEREFPFGGGRGRRVSPEEAEREEEQEAEEEEAREGHVSDVESDVEEPTGNEDWLL